MTKLRVVFMGTPDFAVPCLEMLVDEGYEIAAVVTQPDRPRGRGQKLAASPVKVCAVQHGLAVLQPEKIKTPAFEAQLADLCPDVIVVVAFGQILSKQILDIPRLGCINVHASLLPRYRGAAPIHWSVIHGECVTGVTTMLMDCGLDTGDMLLESRLAIGPNDTTGQVHDALQAAGAQLLRETLRQLAAGNAVRRPQAHDQADYAPLLDKQLEQIDWTKPAVQIHNLIRGLNPWPGAYSCHGGKLLKIWRSRLYGAQMPTVRPGRIAGNTADGFLVETGDGVIELLEVQPAGKRRMTARDYACGYGAAGGDMTDNEVAGHD